MAQLRAVPSGPKITVEIVIIDGDQEIPYHPSLLTRRNGEKRAA